MKSKNIMLLTGLLLSCVGVRAQTAAEKQAAPQELQALNDQPTTQDQKGKKEPPPDYVPYDQPPEVLKQVQPEYPSEALTDKMEGTVWVNVWVDESGRVVEAKVARSEAEVFNQASIDAAKQWAFKPAIAKEKPIAVWVMVPFRFKLSEGKGRAPSMGIPIKAPDKGKKVEKIQEQGAPADYTPYEKAPEVIKQVQPRYPPDAKKAKLEGTVWVKVWIDEKGKVAKTEVTRSERSELNHAAMDAAKQWLFKPALANGKPIAVWVSIPFRFKLADEKKQE